MEMDADFEQKTQRLDRVLEQQSIEELWIGSPENIGWLFGADTCVYAGSRPGVGAVRYDGDEFLLLTDNIEATRLHAEEGLDAIPTETFSWHETSLSEAVAERTRSSAGADFALPGVPNIHLGTVRYPLTAVDIDRSRAIGSDVAQALSRVCERIQADMTERVIAGMLRAELASKGIAAPVVLVGGSQRVQQYGHFTPRDEPIGAYAILSVTAQRHGLHISASRTVAFDPPAWLQDRHQIAANIEASAIAACNDEDVTTAGEVFEAIKHAYAEYGYSETWRSHHQGGAAGYAGREWIATPDGNEPVTAPMIYAWNPMVGGAKSEGTVLVDHETVEDVSLSRDWPTVTGQAVGYEFEISRPGIQGIQ